MTDATSHRVAKMRARLEKTCLDHADAAYYHNIWSPLVDGLMEFLEEEYVRGFMDGWKHDGAQPDPKGWRLFDGTPRMDLSERTENPEGFDWHGDAPYE